MLHHDDDDGRRHFRNKADGGEHHQITLREINYEMSRGPKVGREIKPLRKVSRIRCIESMNAASLARSFPMFSYVSPTITGYSRYDIQRHDWFVD